GHSLTLNELSRVCQLAVAKAAPFSSLIIVQNLFRFEIGPNPTVLPTIVPDPPLFLNVDSFPRRSCEMLPLPR
ncbi:unnamed protein product, partial [Ilex paraguariensis]